MLHTARLFLLAVMASCFFAETPVNATTLVPANIAQLSEDAQQAFIVHISAVEDTLTTTGHPAQKITGTVTESIFGDYSTSQTITWNQFKLKKNLMLPGMPTYEVGKEYMIFLSGPGNGPGFQCPIGLGQGAFLVSRNPATGKANVRNAFRNTNLLTGLAVNKAAEDMVSQSPVTRGMTGPQRKTAIKEKQQHLRGSLTGNLADIKEAAKFFHTRKLQGHSPTMDYRTTSPVQMIKH